MSTETPPWFRVVAQWVSFRAWALIAAAIVSLTYLSVLFRVVSIAGAPGSQEVFLAEVVGVVVFAVVLSRVLSSRAALLLGAVLLGGGLTVYLLLTPGVAINGGQLVDDTVALLTGLSVLRMLEAGIWALGFTPAPLFVSWYFFVRERYAAGIVVAGAALVFFILTGDADTLLGLTGALAAIAVVGFGRLALEEGTQAQRNTIVTILVTILVVTTSVSLVPGGEARPFLSGGPDTVEGSLIHADDQVDIQGSIELSPEVRFTVAANDPRYWRVAAYDRYTGDGWIRTGRVRAYDGPLERPPGSGHRQVRQTFRAEDAVRVMPAAWKPVEIVEGVDRARVTDKGGLQPADGLEPGDRYSVISYVSNPAPAELRAAETTYPAEIEERYLHLPEGTPETVGEFTATLTANADNPYDTAAVIEHWLINNRNYSLDVTRPNGDIAAAFLFEMEQGYCTYFATTMVTMLRSQGIPARFVVGYTTGQQVDDERWVVRGYDSHAWVEVFFPGVGWVAFDPTPPGPRHATEQTRLAEARAEEQASIDTELSEAVTYTPPEGMEDSSVSNPDNVTPGTFETPVGQEPFQPAPSGVITEGGVNGEDANGPLPSRESMLYGFVLFIGAITAAQRTGLFRRGYREMWLRRPPTGSPGDRVEGAFARAEYLMGDRYRARRMGETPRAYVRWLRAEGADTRVVQLYELYEQMRYAQNVTEADAEMAQRLVEKLRDDRSLIGWK